MRLFYLERLPPSSRITLILTITLVIFSQIMVASGFSCVSGCPAGPFSQERGLTVHQNSCHLARKADEAAISQRRERARAAPAKTLLSKRASSAALSVLGGKKPKKQRVSGKTVLWDVEV